MSEEGIVCRQSVNVKRVMAVVAQIVSLVSFTVAGFQVGIAVGFSVLGACALVLGVSWELEASKTLPPIGAD